MEKTVENRKESYANIQNKLGVYLAKIEEDKLRLNKTIEMLENYNNENGSVLDQMLAKIEKDKIVAQYNELNHRKTESSYYNNRCEFILKYTKVIKDGDVINEIGLRYGLLDTILREAMVKIQNRIDEIIDQLNINKSYEIIISSLKDDKNVISDAIKALALSSMQKKDLRDLKISNQERLVYYQGIFKDLDFCYKLRDNIDNDVLLNFDVFTLIDGLVAKKEINDEIQNKK